MTIKNKQMYDDFQMVFNNLESNAAPGLTIFEISMYLTKAYFTFVTSLYNEYEKNELSRKALIELVTDLHINPTSGFNNQKICDNSVFFKLPDDVLYVVYEAIKYKHNTEDKCMSDKTTPVIPVTHDEFHNIYNNPFRFNNKNAIRLDLNISNGRYAEIVAKDSHINYYHLRYVRKPKPIILEDLTGDDRIEGLQEETECELNTMYYKEIVNIAAKMAYSDYKNA